jgi:hypothetical protein
VTATVSILTVGTNWNEKHPYSHIDGKGQREINSRYIIAHDNQIHILHDPEIWQMSCRLQVPYYKLPEDKDLAGHLLIKAMFPLHFAKKNNTGWSKNE